VTCNCYLPFFNIEWNRSNHYKINAKKSYFKFPEDFKKKDRIYYRYETVGAMITTGKNGKVIVAYSINDARLMMLESLPCLPASFFFSVFHYAMLNPKSFQKENSFVWSCS
jgi:hypothetical protein